MPVFIKWSNEKPPTHTLRPARTITARSSRLPATAGTSFGQNCISITASWLLVKKLAFTDNTLISTQRMRGQTFNPLPTIPHYCYCYWDRISVPLWQIPSQTCYLSSVLVGYYPATCPSLTPARLLAINLFYFIFGILDVWINKLKSFPNPVGWFLKYYSPGQRFWRFNSKRSVSYV